MSRELRINYARLWLALISPSSPKVDADRRKYAYAAGNIDESLYPIFQAAITGRAALENAIAEDGGKPKSMMDLGSLIARHLATILTLRFGTGKQSRQEEKMLRSAVVNVDGMITSIFELLRRVPCVNGLPSCLSR